MTTQRLYQTRHLQLKRLVGDLLTLDWGYLALGIVIGLLLNRFLVALLPEQINTLLDSLLPEFVGMVFTVLILDRLNSARQQRLTLEQLVRRAHSRYNHTALGAIEELRVMGELEQGILAQRELRGSNWQDANLYKADLRGADLGNANVFRADFVMTNLSGAKISDEQFAAMDCLYQATMPGGQRYDGRYNLEGDFAHARRKGIDLGSPEEMAEWYGVSLASYLAGQDWGLAHLPRFRQRSTHYDFEDISNRI